MSYMDWGIVLLGGGTICSAIIVWGACRLAGASDDRSERLALQIRNNPGCDDADWQGFVVLPVDDVPAFHSAELQQGRV